MSAPPTCKTCGVRTDLSDNQGYSRCSRHRDAKGYPIMHRKSCIDRGHDPADTPCLDAEDVLYLQAVARDPEGAERWS